MSLLIDTNICSAYLKGDRRMFNRFIQHSGGLYISTITLGELYVWVHLRKTPKKHREGLVDLLSQMIVLPVDQDVANRFGKFGLDFWNRGLLFPRWI